MYGSSEGMVVPMPQGGLARFGGWLPPVKLPPLNMVTSQPAKPVLGLKLSPLPFQHNRRQINVVPVILTLFVPWLIFAAVSGCASFFWRYSSSGICWFLIAFCFVIVLGFGMMSLHQYRKRVVFDEAIREPTWFGPLFGCSLLCWALGLLIGSSNYSANMMPYYSFQSLQSYPDVQPGLTTGKAVLDGGILIFTPKASPDLSKAIAFKNKDTYCIAPVNVSDAAPLVTYDFWAVGKNCCETTPSGGVTFKCAEERSSGTDGMGGLRVISDDASLPYYTLALQQAKERFKIVASTPIFMEWVRDPAGNIGQMQARGLKRYLFWLFMVFGMQLFLVSSLTVIITKSLL